MQTVAGRDDEEKKGGGARMLRRRHSSLGRLHRCRRLQRPLEERRQLADSLFDLWAAVVHVHVIGAFDDVHGLVLAGGARKQVVAHPLAAGDATRDGQQRLGKERFGLVEGVVRNDLAEAARGRIARRRRILGTRRVMSVVG